MTDRVPLDETHDPGRRSWVESANHLESDFPIQNLPFGVFRRGAGDPGIGVAIGHEVLDLGAAAREGVLDLPDRLQAACQAPRLNPLMALGAGDRQVLRRTVGSLLEEGAAAGRDEGLRRRLLVPVSEVRLELPAEVGDYSDFYASLFHATNVGRMFRPDNPLLPNYKWIPIGYHGRASSVAASGAPVIRPSGQRRPPDAAAPSYGPSRQLDYELELGLWVAGENQLGEPVPIEQAEERLFGVSILNDWSARDLQSWEYQPLGPFLAKSFLTTVSPWVVTMEALAPFRVSAFQRPDQDPAPLPYLDSPGNRTAGGLAIAFSVAVSSSRMRQEGVQPVRLSQSGFDLMYWTAAQLLTHHASNGCNLRPGDLIGSGTISGPSREERGCLLELTWRGTEPLKLPTGEERKFLEDGDEVIMTAWCERPGARRIGLGECRGMVQPARPVAGSS